MSKNKLTARGLSIIYISTTVFIIMCGAYVMLPLFLPRVLCPPPTFKVRWSRNFGQVAKLIPTG